MKATIECTVEQMPEFLMTEDDAPTYKEIMEWASEHKLTVHFSGQHNPGPLHYEIIVSGTAK